ncbi:MAG: hypothetical protein AUI47_09275 [Acidobacteria bacterium 13_1_40CM_2_68_5]|nr:MAG: hypothetical protein AUI47_09275 [Acidobacteria bacterium 13_1_40CM_2_68_5]
MSRGELRVTRSEEYRDIAAAPEPGVLRDDQILNLIEIDVRNDHFVREEPRRNRAGPIAAVGRRQEQRRAARGRVETAEVGHGQVGTTVPVQVGDRNRNGMLAGGIADLRLERSVTPSIKDRYVRRARVGCGQIDVAVAVEVGAHESLRAPVSAQGKRFRIRAISAAEADRNASVAAWVPDVSVGKHQVWYAILVHVRDQKRRWLIPA